MICCVCGHVTEKFLIEAIENGCKNIEEVKAYTGAADCCLKCEDFIKEYIENFQKEKTK